MTQDDLPLDAGALFASWLNDATAAVQSSDADAFAGLFDRDVLEGLEAAGFKTYQGTDETGFQLLYLRGSGGYYIARLFSRFLALQIKASLEGLMPSRDSLAARVDAMANPAAAREPAVAA